MNAPTITKMIMPALCTIWAAQQDATHTRWNTAAHCVPEIGQVVTIEAPTADRRHVEARVIAKDTTKDTATLLAWTSAVGPITTRPQVAPAQGPATIDTHRGTLTGNVTDRTIDIPGLTPRQIVDARVIPGDSGSPVTQQHGVIGTITHSVGGCNAGFCPTDPTGRLLQSGSPLINGDPLGITLRDVICAILGYFGIGKWLSRKPPTPPTAPTA